MNSVKNNPFKIIGIPANASAKDIQSRKSKIQAYSRVGKDIPSDFDFPFLPSVERTESLISRAFSDIEHNADRVHHSLFWFTKVNAFDEMALKYLENDDVQKAKDIWKKITWDKEVSATNWSAFNNISTLLLWDYEEDFADEDFHEIINAKIKLMRSDFFNDFILSVADQTYAVAPDKQIEIYLDKILKELPALGFDSASAIRLFEDCDNHVRSYVLKSFTSEKITTLEHIIEKAKEERNKDSGKAYLTGKNLLIGSKPILDELKANLGVNDSNYTRLADSVAKELLQCSVDYFNKTQEVDNDDNHLNNAMTLARAAEKVALGKMLKDRIKDNISTLEGMKDREINEAVSVLQMLQKLYEDNSRKIDEEVKMLMRTDFGFQIGTKTINWTSVEENKKNSINWTQVNNLLTEVLSPNKLKKIKSGTDQDLKDQFWNLLHWLKEKSTGSQINQFIQNYKDIPPKLCFEILSAEVTNTASKPLTVEEVRYIGLKINVKSQGSQKVKIFKKYVDPDGRYSHSSKSSPEGYTTAKIFAIIPNSNQIDLGGWGSEDKCTYQVGEHRIELYIDHYLVFTKKFNIDWSPAKKAALTRNLNMLKEELKEIEKFKWFRGAETKQNELKVVQDKINKANLTLMNK